MVNQVRFMQHIVSGQSQGGDVRNMRSRAMRWIKSLTAVQEHSAVFKTSEYFRQLY